MRCFILPEHYDGAGTVIISGRDARRLVKVLRLSAGDTFPAMDSNGRRYHCTLLRTDVAGVVLSVQEHAEAELLKVTGVPHADIRRKSRMRGTGAGDAPAQSASVHPVSGKQYSAEHRELGGPGCFIPELVLAVGFLKGQKLDDVVRAGTELGFCTIQLLETERSVPQETGTRKLARYERIVKEALGQSGSDVITRVRAPCLLSEFLAANKVEQGVGGIVFHEKRINSVPVHTVAGNSCKKLILCVGPEGGFSDHELEQFLEHGYVPVWLGPSVLRADTAAIAAMSIAKLLFVERYAWQAK